ncbi:hypothetical protein Q4603_05665 [Zobellia galactanivorans]|uniref:hypothetical protein n=1 Tax=Zobellia galactanivorans (strain DSM 12802 / CCUG 47099 / CIP 106680 / NCIMB 13871 / Dsij) TaxID=63186 RepID=UPI0026E11E20|nr:hypothetical protein [Zobellia galactanivorans]MDO6808082.1 hypothetical protein [Zobellia galactanivorans]
MYRIDNIPILNYGLTPGRAPGSNIALSGHLDLNARSGKAYHDWGEEEGVEPYVSEHDLVPQNYERKQVVFYAYITATSRAGIVERMEDLYHDLSLLGEFTLSSPWGDVTGYVKEKVSVDWLGVNAASVKIVIDGVGNYYNDTDELQPSSSGLHHIDNVALSDYGAKVIGVTGNFDRPETKEPYYTNADAPYQVTKPGYKEFSLELLFYASTYEAMSTSIGRFNYQLMKTGTRVMNVDGLERECFNIEGTKVSNVKVNGSLAVCTVKLPMALAYDGVPKDTKYLHDHDNINITSMSGKFISIQEPNVLELTDNKGRKIKTNDYNTLTV